MATAASGNAGVGTIKVVTGDVKIIGVDGVARQAQVGDKVFARETIQTNANAIVQVQLENGRMLDLGRDSKIALDNDIIGPQGPSATTAPATGDIAAIQAQIAAGADPSKVAEATAAGGAPGAGGADGGGGTGVVIDQANSIGPVTSGFNTAPASIAFATAQDPQFINRAPTIEGKNVFVSEEGLDGGNLDENGNGDTTDDSTITGTLNINDLDGQPLTVRLSAPTDPLTSGGETIVWTLSANGHTLTGTINGGSVTIITVNVDDDGGYIITLLGPIDHPDTGGEDDLDIKIPVTVTDPFGASATANLVVTVEDDSPTLAGCECEPILLYANDFSGGLEGGTGTAMPNGWSTIDGYSGTGSDPVTIVNGRLRLTDESGNDMQWLKVDSGAAFEGSFTAKFDVIITDTVEGGEGGSVNGQADGFSFQVGNDVDTNGLAEDPQTSGFALTIDTYDNGGEQIPTIEVWFNGVLLDSYPNVPANLIYGGPLHVSIEVDHDQYTVTITNDSGPVWSAGGNMGGELPADADFYFGARTGSAADIHEIDNVEIVALCDAHNEGGEGGGGETPAAGGAIFITGHDSDEHQNEQYQTAGLDYLMFGHAATGGEVAARANVKIVFLANDISSPGNLAGEGWTNVTIITNPADYANAFTGGYDVIMVGSGGNSTDRASLVALQSQFAAFINGGGALYINTDEGFGQTWYDFVPNFGTAANNSISANGAFSATPAGNAIGLTEAIVDADTTHSYYTGVNTSLFTVFEVTDPRFFPNNPNQPVAFGARGIGIKDGGFVPGEECVAAITATVREDGMRISTSDLSNGNQNPDNLSADEHVSSAGSLRALFSFGADGPGDFVMLTNTSGLPELFSKGDAVGYSVSGNMLTATADGRVVFTLKLNADGSWSFDLKDQLDHVDNGLNDENTALRDGEGSVNSLDFSSLIQAYDGDGDKAPALPPGTFAITVVDDIPVHVDRGQVPVGGLVREDGMHLTTGDLSEGNQNNHVGTPTNTSADEYSDTSAPNNSLARLVSAGADEELTFSIKLDEGDLPQLYSQGDPVEYDVSDDGHTLTATADGRTVFVLTVNADGSWNFDLQDQLDHVAPPEGQYGSENNDLVTGENSSVPNIDFSKLILVTDADGDELELLGEGDFIIAVRDDIPVAADGGEGVGRPFVRATVEEDGMSYAGVASMPSDNSEGNKQSHNNNTLANAQDIPRSAFGVQSNPDLENDALPSVSINGFVSPNTDQDLYKVELQAGETITLDIDYGMNDVDTVVTLYRADGTMVAQNDDRGSLDNGSVHGFDSYLTFTVPAGGTYYVGLTSFPNFPGNGAPSGTGSSSGDYVLNMSITPTGSSTGLGGSGNGYFTDNELGDSNSDDEASGGAGSLTALFSVGADEPATISLTNDEGELGLLPRLLSQGDEVRYELVGSVLTAYAGDDGDGDADADADSDSDLSAERVVFTLTVNGDGSWSFDLRDQLDHVPGDGENTALQLAGGGSVAAIDFSQLLAVTDADGDRVVHLLGEGQFAITVEDDVPVRTQSSITVTVDEDDISSQWSLGTSPFDGNSDGSDTENAPGPNDPAIVTGSLAGLVSIGSDEPATYGFTADVIAYMTGLGLYSKQTALPENGESLTYSTSTSGNWIILTGTEPDTVGPNTNSNPVFELRVNTATGAYEFRLFDELIHKAPPAGTADENFDLRSGSAGATIPGINFGAIIEVTDADGDSITLDNAFTVNVRDDIPEVHLSVVRNADGANHDETPGWQLGDVLLTGLVAPLFSGVASPGNDPDVAGSGAIGYARSGLAVVTTAGTEQGADTPPLATGFTLEALSSISGLQVTDGSAINLAVEGNLLVGRVSGGAFDGQAAFAIAVDSGGEIFVAQYLSIRHPIGGASHDEEVNLDGKIQIRYSVTDSDGDTVSQAVEMGELVRFDDDGPSANANFFAPLDTLVLDETRPVGTEEDGDSNPTGRMTTTANFADNFFTPDFGADGPGGVAYTLSLTGSNVNSGLFALDATDTSSTDGDGIGRGTQIVLNQSGNVVTGSANGTDYFTITIDNATGVATFSQLANIWHGDTSSDDDTATLTLANANLLRVIQTVTDGDNDTASDSVNIGRNVFRIEDDGPNAVVNVSAPVDTLTLDETRAVGTEEDGDSNPAGLMTVTANFADNFETPDYGSDGPGNTAYTLALTGSGVASGLYALQPSDTSAGDGDGIGQGTQIVLNQSGSTITGSVGATNYFTITIDSATGVVTFTQINNIWHADINSDDDTATLTLANANLLRVVQTITDADGDRDSTAINLGQGVFSIEDDGPNAVVNVSMPVDTLVLDETRDVGTEEDGDSAPAGLMTTTANFADNFMAADYGSDGAGNAAYTLTLSGINVNSGLYALDATDTESVIDGIGQGAQIVLNQSGNTITGSVGSTNYFTITIDNTTGVVTFTQQANIWHANTGNDDDTATLTLSGNDSLRVVQTLTDADGDRDSTAINLGQGVFQIEDDGPNVIVSINTQLESGSNPVMLTTQDAETDGDPTHFDTATSTANFSGVFVITPDYGSDGPGTTTTAYALSLAVTPGTASGLMIDQEPGGTQAVNLYMYNGVVVGSNVPLSEIVPGVPNTENWVFTLSVNNSGEVTLTQFKEIDHAVDTDGGPTYDDQFAVLANGLVNLTGTATTKDADGDTDIDSKTIDLGGNVRFADDGPSLTQVTEYRTVDEDDIDTAWSEGTSPNDGSLDGSTTDGAGAAFISGTLAGLVNSGADSPIVSYTFTATAVAQMTALGLYSKQTALPENGEALTYTVSGPDGLGIMTLTATEPDTVGPNTNSNIVFELKLNTANGNYEFRLFDELIHKAGEGQNTDLRSGPNVSGQATVPHINFGAIIKATDDDGDYITLNNAFTVTVTDDIPEVQMSIVGNPSGVNHDESTGTQDDDTGFLGTVFVAPLFSGVTNPGNDPDVPPTSGPIGYAAAGSVIYSHSHEVGADAPAASTQLSLQILDAASGLNVTDGSPITLVLEGGLIVGRVVGGAFDGQAAFAVAAADDILSNSGRIYVAQYLSLQHPNTGSADEEVNLLGKIAVRFTVTDSDGDTVFDQEPIGHLVRFDDDGPVMNVRQSNESSITLTTQDADTIGAANDTAVSTAAFSGVFSMTSNYGADGAGNTTPLSYALNLSVAAGTDSGFDSNGVQVNLYNIGGVIVGATSVPTTATDASVVFSIAVDSAGVVTLTQRQEIDHTTEVTTTAPFDDQFAVLATGLVSLTATATITDGDGDTATDSETVDLGGNIRFADHGPSVTQNAVVQLDDDALANGNPGGTNDDADSVFTSGTLGHNFGADGAGSIAYLTTGNPGGFTYVASGSDLLVKQGSVTVLTLTLNSTTGAYTVVQNAPIQHAAGDNENNQVFTIGYRVTDGDNDTATGTLSINVDDDTPVVTVNPANAVGNGLFFDGFTPNGDAWGTGSGVATGTAGAWTITGASPNLERVFEHRGAISPTGSLVVDLDASPGNVSISQTVSGLTAGEKYRLSFEIGEAEFNVPSAASLEVYWNGNLVGTFEGASGVMQVMGVDVVATGATGTLEFREVGVVDNTGTYLANIRLTDQIIIDETPGVDADSDDTTSGAVSGLFAAVATVGVDPAMAAQYATGSTAVVVATPSYGADGPGVAPVYALQVTNGTNSGLLTTEGKVIQLYQEGNLVVGRYDADGNGSFETAAIAFAINSSTGVASVAQYVSLQHPLNPQGDEGMVLAPGSLRATVTITDSDGDPATASANISNFFRFEDDAPSLVADTNSMTEDTLTVSGGVMGNDGSGADQPLTFVGWTTLTGTYGTLTNTGNGNYIYTLNNGLVQGLDDTESVQDQFTYTARDADGDVRSSTLTITINGANDAPTITTQTTVRVSEEGLTPNGLPDTTGNTDTTNLKVQTGTIAVNDVDIEPLTVTLTAPPSGLMSTDGTLISWALSNGGHTLTGTAGSSTIVTVSITDGGAYTVNLSGAVKHPNTTEEDNQSFNVGVSVSDGTASANGTLTVIVEDDSPANPANVNKTIGEGGGNSDTNVMLILDVSGSMGGAGITTLKASVTALLDAYDAAGNIMVRIVTFGNGSASAIGTVWMDIATAKAAVNALGTGGLTDFDEALLDAMSAFASTGRIGGAQNVSYFISDGNPTANEDWPASLDGAATGLDPVLNSNGIQSTEQAHWESFLDTNDIKSYALGMGTGITLANLQPIAYDGIAGAEIPAVVVNNLGDLTGVLLATVGNTVEGNLTTEGSLTGMFGADGPGTPQFFSIVHGSTTYLASAGNLTNVTTAAGGKFDFNFTTGAYKYTAPANVNNDTTVETFTYTIVDGDGDKKSANLNISVLDGVPVANDDTVAAAESFLVQSGTLSESVTINVPASWSASRSSVNVGSTDEVGPNFFGGPLFDNSSTFTVTADAGHTAIVTYDLHVQGFQGSDTVSVGLFNAATNIQVGTSVFSVASVNGATFTITASGSYYLRLTADDNSLTGNLKAELDDVSVASYTFTPASTLATTIAVPDVTWSIAPITGNVLTNDTAEADAIKVVTTTGVFDGAYGTLVLNADGTFTYTPDATDFTGPFPKVDTFTYTLRDGSSPADTDTAVLTINLADHVYSSSSNNSANFVGGGDGNDTLSGQDGNDVVYGGAGNDTLNGEDDNDHLIGGTGNDTLNGGEGNDRLVGGDGNDILVGGDDSDVLIGGTGADTFRWGLGDASDGGVDIVKDFNENVGDKLDLSALLEGDSHIGTAPGNLANFLHFYLDSGNTVIEVKADGAGSVDQRIVLQGVDLTAGGTLSDNTIITNLLIANKLDV